MAILIVQSGWASRLLMKGAMSRPPGTARAPSGGQKSFCLLGGYQYGPTLLRLRR